MQVLIQFHTIVGGRRADIEERTLQPVNTGARPLIFLELRTDERFSSILKTLFLDLTFDFLQLKKFPYIHSSKYVLICS